MGGALVGIVDKIEPTRGPGGEPIALMDLKLNKEVEPLPVDSTFDVRLKGAIGLKYLEVTRGTSSQTWPNGATVPLSQSGSEVDLDQVLSMFDPPTRVGVAQSTIGFSDALAGRGNDINDAIGAFVPLVTDLGPVARNLASPKTDLGGFFRGLESFTRALVPVAQDQADLYGNLDTTFTRAGDRRGAVPAGLDLEDAADVQSVIAASPRLQSFLTDTAGLFAELRPGFATLPQSAPVLADAFAAGTENLPGTIALDQRLTSPVAVPADLRRDPGGHGRARPADADRQEPALAAGVPDAGPVDVQLRDAVPAQHLEPAVRADRRGYGAAVRTSSRSTTSPASEGVPSQRPYTTPQHPSTGSTGRCTSIRIRTPTRPARRRSAPPATSRIPRAARVIGNPPGNLGLQDREDHEAQAMRRHRHRVSNVAAGLIAVVVIGVACYLVFGGSLPFSGSPFVLKAMFTTQTQLHIPSPVRIAGVDVGQVVSVQRVSGSSDAAVVTMDINKNGLPIHADATAKIRPRLFLEGNFYVDLHPGTPSAPIAVVGRHAAGRAERRARCSSTACWRR